jgi:transcriptional regulator with GAF, ATPase, and Fis domain
MAESDMFTGQLADAARSMQGENGTQDTLDKAVVIATELIECCDLAGISIVHHNGIETPAGSDAALRRIDELQYELKEGPCLDALLTHETVHSTGLADDERWPKWGPRVATEIGVASNVSYRLFTTKDTLGAMNLYSRKPEAFDTEDIYNGQALAAHVAVALASAQNAENLETAVTNRTVIGQAEGILMERFDISAEHAFSVLRRVSQQRNVKLSRVAEQLVTTRETPS